MRDLNPLPSDFLSDLASAQAGDGRGFDRLHDRVVASLTTFATARGAVDPDQSVNDAFFRAFRSIGTFEGDEDGFRRWLFVILRRQLVDEHRMAARRPRLVDASTPESPTMSAEAAALARLGNERVARLLGQLTDDQREVITLRILADLSIADVAQIVDKPVTAVKRLQARGIQALERLLVAEQPRTRAAAEGAAT